MRKTYPVVRTLLIAIVVILYGIQLNGAVITVTTTEDHEPGSLRAAIDIANSNGENNIIYLPDGTYRLSGAGNEDANRTGDLDIMTSNRLDIIGTAAQMTIIDGDEADRVLDIFSGEVRIYNVTVRNGKIPDYGPYQGSRTHGGGIYNRSNLTMTDCIVYKNCSGSLRGSDDQGGNGGNGGGIYSDNYLRLDSCEVMYNGTASGRSGTIKSGKGGDGAGIYSTGALYITHTTIRNNITGDGADSMENPGTGGNGAGVWGSFTVIINNSTINHNSSGKGARNLVTGELTAGGSGGGIYLYGQNCSTYLTNSTVSSNESGSGGESGTDRGAGGNGGGIAVYGASLNMSACTVTQNGTAYAATGANSAQDNSMGGGIYNNGDGTVTISNTILAGNKTPDNNRGNDGIGTIDSLYGSNLIQDTDRITLTGTQTGNITGQDPQLGPLEGNGGYTMTHAPQPGSPVIDAGNFTYQLDQRLHSRPEDIAGVPNSGNGSDIGAVEYQASGNHIYYFNQTVIKFSADTAGNQSGPQEITLWGGQAQKWQLVTTNNYPKWFTVTPTEGEGTATKITVTVDPKAITTGPGTTIGTISVESPDSNLYSNVLPTIQVVLELHDATATTPPVGSFDTPEQGSIVRSSVPVTGWAVDDMGIQGVKIYRESIGGDGSRLVYIGDAVQVEGARPDIEAVYRHYPDSERAGWGYMLLTNYLPNGGNGDYTLHAIATDPEGNRVTLGIKTITVDNATAVNPFGAIDTPEQGGIASGRNYIAYGWTLTPQPNTIPFDGSTIKVWIDGVYKGNPVYNQYRSDIAEKFPGYNNSNGAVGYFYIDTTAYLDGVHTIQWTAKDDAGNIDGIGSRFFAIQNGNGRHKADAQAMGIQAHDNRQKAAGEKKKYPGRKSIPIKPGPVHYKTGFDENAEMQTTYPAEDGTVTIDIEELERLEIQHPHREGATWEIQRPPIGSTMDAKKGIYYWSPGPGFVGSYHLQFIRTGPFGQKAKKTVRVNISPKSIIENK